MLKQKKEVSITLFMIEIYAIIHLIIGVIGILFSIFNFHQLNSVHFCAMISTSLSAFLISLIILIIHNQVYFEKREEKKWTYMQYNRLIANDLNLTVSLTALLNSAIAIIAIILIIWGIIF